MSVVLGKRTTSKIEAIEFSVTLHDLLFDLMRRNFGIKDLDNLVRDRYARGEILHEDFAFFRNRLLDAKKRIDYTASLLTGNTRAANTIYPTTIKEYQQRRAYQNDAIVNCEQLKKELQRVVDVFKVDVNTFKECSDAIKREIDLIKKWRQRDNRFRTMLKEI